MWRWDIWSEEDCSNESLFFVLREKKSLQFEVTSLREVYGFEKVEDPLQAYSFLLGEEFDEVKNCQIIFWIEASAGLSSVGGKKPCFFIKHKRSWVQF